MINPIHYMDYDDLEWYEKLDVIEWCLDYLYKHLNSDEIHKLDCGIIDLNKEFERQAGSTGKCKISDLFEELGFRV